MKLIDTRDAVGHVLCHDLTQIIPGLDKAAWAALGNPGALWVELPREHLLLLTGG